MINIAILGFGVVGSGVAEVIFRNSKELASRLDGEELNIKYILYKREFPDHPLGNRVVNDIDVILNDEDVFLVVETMGGLHPAYDFSKKALLAGAEKAAYLAQKTLRKVQKKIGFAARL